MDKRRARGERTRSRVLRRAAELASVDGLDQLSLGRLASDLDLSKSGVAVAFGSKQELQLATVAAAQDVFLEQVVAPALRAAPGIERLRALVSAWLAYVRDRVFPGGCFLVAVLPEFDTRPGPVRDALRESRRAWLDLLTGEAARAQADRDLGGDLAAEDVAFEIAAVLAAANLARNIDDDETALDRADAIIRARLDR
jgi:AcrR family transcriptional regulator